MEGKNEAERAKVWRGRRSESLQGKKEGKRVKTWRERRREMGRKFGGEEGRRGDESLQGKKEGRKFGGEE